MSVELTSKCNLRCEMCSVWKGMRDGVPFERIVGLLHEARGLGAEVFTPSGAEVFMRKDTPAILEAAAACGFAKISVVTNGMLIARQIDRLADIPGLALHISLDGPEDVHDALRGPGSYQSAIAGLEAAQGAGIEVSVKAVLMRQTLATAGHLVGLARRYGLPRISFQPYQPEIGGPEADHDHWGFDAAARSEVDAALARLRDLARQAGVAIHTEGLFPHIVPYLFDGHRPVPPGGCALPARFLLVDGRGEVYPCFFMRRQSMGNVMRGVRLTDIWHGPVQTKMQHAGAKGACPGCLAGCSDVPGFAVPAHA
ncbi:MAG: radical SAM protein [Pseudomonadota bacterium]